MKHALLMIMFLIALAGAGCKDIKPGESAAAKEDRAKGKRVFKVIDQPELAKIILKPERKPLAIERDPFRPILTKDMGLSALPDSASGLAQELGDVAVIGIIMSDTAARVCLSVNKKVGVYHLNEKVGNYVITQITNDQVTLKSPEHEIVKKRGKK